MVERITKIDSLHPVRREMRSATWYKDLKKYTLNTYIVDGKRTYREAIIEGPLPQEYKKITQTMSNDKPIKGSLYSTTNHKLDTIA